MRFEKVNFQRTFSLGHGTFESMRLGADVILEEGDDFNSTMSLVKKKVEQFFNENPPSDNPMLTVNKRGTGSSSVRVLHPSEYSSNNQIIDEPVIDKKDDVVPQKPKLVPDAITKKKLDNAVMKGDIETFEQIISKYDIPNEKALRKIVNTNIKIPSKKK